MHGEQRAERVAVGVLVRGEQELVRAAQLLDDLVRSPVAMLIASSNSSVIRIPRSIDSSKTNSSVGVRFIRSSRAIAACSTPWADASPASVSVRSASSPSTLTYTRAWRGRGLCLPTVTVTNPMRGSFSPSAIRAERTSRTASFTLRMRSEATLMQVLGRYEQAFHAGTVGKQRPHVARSTLAAAVLEQAGVAPTSAAVIVGALPELVMVGLGHRGAEAPLELRLERGELLALALEAPRSPGSAGRSR